MNLPYEQNWIDPQAARKLEARATSGRDGMALRPMHELQALYAGLDREREVIVYCQTGLRASMTAAVLRELGFRDVKVYEPSWLGYASQLALPAKQEAFVNIGALNNRMAALQERIRNLEAELAVVRAVH